MKLPVLDHQHTPSKEKVKLNTWWDFMLHSNQLFDKKTGIAACYHCGATIKLPVEYGKLLPLIAYKASIGATVIFRVLLNILDDHTSMQPILVVITAVLSAAFLLFAVVKVATSRILSQYHWVCFDDTDKCISSNVIQETVADTNRIRYSIWLGAATTYTVIWLTQWFG